MTIPERLRANTNALKVEDLAELLNSKAGTLYKMAKAGRIPHFHIGTALRFDAEEIARWIDQRATR